MADAIIHYDQTAGLSLYVQFDDTDNTRVQMSEGTLSKLRRYFVTDTALVLAGLDASTGMGYYATIRVGLAVSPGDSDAIVGVVPNFQWSGSVEMMFQVDVRQ